MGFNAPTCRAAFGLAPAVTLFFLLVLLRCVYMLHQTALALSAGDVVLPGFAMLLRHHSFCLTLRVALFLYGKYITVVLTHEFNVHFHEQ